MNGVEEDKEVTPSSTDETASKEESEPAVPAKEVKYLKKPAIGILS